MTEIAGIISIKKQINPDKCFVLSDVFNNVSENEISSFLDQSQNSGFCCKDSTHFYHAEEENITISYSGNIYNTDEIKIALKNEGVSIETSEITHILVKAYQHWGENFIQHVNGAFALVIWDGAKKEGFVYRDRLGKKPLFYIWDGEALHYSSELNSLTRFIQKDKWDYEAIQHFFRLGYIPAPHTIYQDIKKLEPGNYIHVYQDIGELKSYWILENQLTEETVQDEVYAKKEYHELLQSSVQMRLGDKTGIFFSGGIDSSLIAAVSQSLSDQKISTFSVKIEGAPRDESKYAEMIAGKLGTNHYEIPFNHSHVINHIKNFVQWYEEPYADASGLPSFIASKQAKMIVENVFLGDGGDEQFLGYGMHLWAERLHKYTFFRNIVRDILSYSVKLNHQRVSQYFDFKRGESFPAHIFSVDQGFFSGRELSRNFHFEEHYKALELLPTARKLSPGEYQSLYDLKFYLPNDLTRKVERVSSQVGLNIHSPLLDYRLVEKSINFDKNLKLKDGGSKYLLRQILFDYLPKEMFERPKWGFGIPLNKWLSKELREILEAYVNREVLSKYDFYNVEAILQLKEEYLNGKTYLYNQLWLVILFNIWAEKQKS